METRLGRARKAKISRLHLNWEHIRIGTLDRLVAYLEAIRKDHVQDICVVEIELSDKWGQPVRRISNLLRQATSIDTLRIDMRKLSTYQGIQIFKGVSLPKLEHLSSNNIHHTPLSEFVGRHTKIRSLSVGCCSGGRCCLSTLSGELNLQEITGPLACIYGLVSQKTERLHIIWDPSNASEDQDTKLFARVEAVKAKVSLMSIPFFPGDLGFTARLSAALPQLLTLKLIEAPRQPEEEEPVYYPWAINAGGWKAGLQSLMLLKRLYLQTVSAPITQPGHKERELALIRALVGVNQQHLVDITLAYSCEEFHYESMWQRAWGTERWTRFSHSQTSKMA